MKPKKKKSSGQRIVLNDEHGSHSHIHNELEKAIIKQVGQKSRLH